MIRYIKSWFEEYIFSANQLAILCGLFAFSLFLIFQNHADHSDGVDYAFSVKTGSGLFHPHHVLYSTFGFIVHRGLSLIIDIDPLILLTLMSSLVTAMTVVLFFLLVMQITESESISLYATAFYTFNYSTLYMGTTTEVYPYSVLCELLALLVTLRARRLSWLSLTLVSGLCALAVLFHQSAIFFVLAIIVFIAIQLRAWRMAAMVALFSGFLTISVYVFAASRNDIHDLHGFVRWIFFYAHTNQYEIGDWGGGFALSRFPDLLSGIVTTIVKPNWQKYLINQRLIVDFIDYGFYSIVSILAIGIVILLLWLLKWRKIGAEKQPLRVLLGVWLLGGALFVAWWNADNIEFWYMLVAPALLLLALRLRELLQHGVRRSRGLLLIAASLLFANLAGRVYADAQPQSGLSFQIIAAIGCERIASGDLIIGPIWDLPPAIRYQCGKSTAQTSMHAAPREPAALTRHAQQLFAGRTHVYFLETELVRSVRSAYFESTWQDPDVADFYRPLLHNATPIGTFKLYGTRYQIFELPLPLAR